MIEFFTATGELFRSVAAALQGTLLAGSEWFQHWNVAFLAFLVLLHVVAAVMRDNLDWPPERILHLAALQAVFFGSVLAVAFEDPASLLAIGVYLLFTLNSGNLAALAQADRLGLQPPAPLHHHLRSLLRHMP